MIIDIIKKSLLDVMSDLGILGWLIISIYVGLFGFSIIRMIINAENRKQKLIVNEKRQQVRARIDEINLRLAEIRLARQEEEEKLRLEAAEREQKAEELKQAEQLEKEERYKEDLANIAIELEDDESWNIQLRKQVIADIEEEEVAVMQELEQAEFEEETAEDEDEEEEWVIR